MSAVKTKIRKTLQGTVVSAHKIKGGKTIVVKVSFRKQDPRFKKTVGLSKKVMAHDEKEEACEGDVVVIEESRPYSKRKRYVLRQIVTRRAEEIPLVV
jgi:small subunit ribosomal protein S17